MDDLQAPSFSRGVLTVENLVEIAGEQREDAEEILGVGESE